MAKKYKNKPFENGFLFSNPLPLIGFERLRVSRSPEFIGCVVETTKETPKSSSDLEVAKRLV